MQIAKTQRERGFVLITMAIITIALIGALGMAVDVGRAFIAKNETQAFCDAASMAAVLKMDGTATGISNAKTAVANTTNAWNMDTASVSNPTIDFATSESVSGDRIHLCPGAGYGTAAVLFRSRGYRFAHAKRIFRLYRRADSDNFVFPGTGSLYCCEHNSGCGEFWPSAWQSIRYTMAESKRRRVHQTALLRRSAGVDSCRTSGLGLKHQWILGCERE